MTFQAGNCIAQGLMMSCSSGPLTVTDSTRAAGSDSLRTGMVSEVISPVFTQHRVLQKVSLIGHLASA